MASMYFVNITLGGQPFTVILDTGSSDLWVYAPDANINVLNDSQLTANITYGRGSISGTVQFAELQVGEYVVPSQAFIRGQKLGDGFPAGLTGIIGISFDSDLESEVARTIHRAWGESNTLGHTVFSNILGQNRSLQPFFDLSLNRAEDLELGDTKATLIIGHHDPRYSAVAEAPQVPRIIESMWTGYVDGMNINGQPFQFPPAITPYTPSGKLVSLFDSGSAFIAMPGAMMDAVFEQIAGSIKVNETWYAPCYSSVNLTFTIAGQDYPVHPLDISLVTQLTVLESGTSTTFTVCSGAFLSLGPEGVNGADMVLGDPFLKNVYASFNFGPENAEGDHNGTSGSYLQFLSLTNADDAWLDFFFTRAAVLSLLFPATIDPVLLPQLFPSDFGAVENTIATSLNTSPTSTAPALASSSVAVSGALGEVRVDDTPVLGSSGAASASGAIDKYGPAVVGLLGANLAVMVLLCVVALSSCTRGVMRGGVRARSVDAAYAPVKFEEPKPEAAYIPEYDAPALRYGE
ncbi:acid protease [Phanerochaete sordida]|uniref:Acid protease n=1 Tax=Phanerochaete sordida TaxID=48140 RepID=A0A9P3GIQ7_9APHY|nr:acid protease [Phanerochaete sordida]